MAHSHETLPLGPPSLEPSFPSDHAVAAFAIAFSMPFVGGVTGAAFLAEPTHAGRSIHGLTPDELDAMAALLAVYVGYPRASVAVEVIREVVAAETAGEMEATDRVIPGFRIGVRKLTMK